MRKVTQKIKAAFEAGKSLTVGNTKTDGQTVWLHGNAIVKRDASGLVLASLAGWNTVTTRERVNGIAGFNFHHVKGKACLDGQPIDKQAWFVKCHDGAKQSLKPLPFAI